MRASTTSPARAARIFAAAFAIYYGLVLAAYSVWFFRLRSVGCVRLSSAPERDSARVTKAA